MGIGTTTPGYKLDVTGDAQISGNLNLGFITVSNAANIFVAPASTVNRVTISCPSGTRLLSGGGGYRQFTLETLNVLLNYNGPDPDNPTTTWLLHVYNNATTTREIYITCNCARIQ